MSRTRTLRFAEICLWAAGCAALSYCGYIWTKAWIAQRQGNRELDRSFSTGVVHRPQAPSPGALIGRVEIPRLNVHAVIFEGTDDDELDRGVGHMRGSALPGGAGNVVLAAHRDTFFRSLKNIREHETITISTLAGPRHYQVESVRVVSPYDTSVAQPTPQPMLTLITCYPFEFLGHAPERYIVQAREVLRPAAEPVAEPKVVSTKVEPARPQVRQSAVRDYVTAPFQPVPVALANEPVHMNIPSPAPPAFHETPRAAQPAVQPVQKKPAPADQAAATPAPHKHKFGWMNPGRVLKKIPLP